MWEIFDYSSRYQGDLEGTGEARHSIWLHPVRTPAFPPPLCYPGLLPSPPHACAPSWRQSHVPALPQAPWSITFQCKFLLLVTCVCRRFSWVNPSDFLNCHLLFHLQVCSHLVIAALSYTVAWIREQMAPNLLTAVKSLPNHGTNSWHYPRTSAQTQTYAQHL